MTRLLRAAAVSAFLMVSFNANAWFGGDDCPPWAYDCNDWPEWTPMYWMEEFSDAWDDNDDYYRYGYGYGYGRPMMPYGPQGAPYGMPYGAAPYGAPYGAAPYPAPMPYGMQPPVPPQPQAPQQ